MNVVNAHADTQIHFKPS